MNKHIEYNKKKFSRRIEQLSVITKDSSYIPKFGSLNGYHEFIFSMYEALISGRKITPKMELAITNIVKSYAKHLKDSTDPKLYKEKADFIDSTLNKLNIIKKKLNECNYTVSYTTDKLYFLNSIEKQVHNRGSLTAKQMKALNNMYKQFDKKVKNSEKNT
tara:strand:- start:631 stop:1113 length:483 start_codon:yes stop_codon:yes gene_type:complete